MREFAKELVAIRCRHSDGTLKGDGVPWVVDGVRDHKVTAGAVQIVGACRGGCIYDRRRVEPRVGGELVSPIRYGRCNGARSLRCGAWG